MVSSRSRLVDSSVTGVSASSSIRQTYLTACAGRLASAARGCRRSTSARRLGRVGAVVVEPSAGLAAVPAGLDVFHQQRAGAVFAIGQPLVQHLHDRQAGIEADEVGELEWAHLVVG